MCQNRGKWHNRPHASAPKNNPVSVLRFAIERPRLSQPHPQMQKKTRLAQAKAQAQKRRSWPGKNVRCDECEDDENILEPISDAEAGEAGAL